jgi:outer membrane lipoprotein-sorting protein
VAGIALAACLSFGASHRSAAAAERDQASAGGDALVQAAGLVSEIVDRYERARSCRLEFEQSNYWALADSTYTTGGTLLLERPNKVSVRYADGSRIVVREDSVRVYVPSTRQLFIAPVDSSDVAIDPARLLKSYRPDTEQPFLPIGQGESTDLRRLNLKPRTAGLEPTRLEALVDARRSLVQKLTVMWSTGDSVVYNVRETRFDVQIDKDEFVIHRPPGVKLVREMP